MRIQGQNTVAAPVADVWRALLDPAVLVRTIPGCERLVETAPHTYDMTVTAGVAAIRGTYQGTCSLADLDEPASLVMRLSGAGGPGTVDATVTVAFAEDDGGTRVSYDADAVVGGMVGGVGQRMLTSVSRRMAGEFFDNVARSLVEQEDAPAPTDGESPAAPPSTVFTAPRPSTGSTGDDFVKGVAVGAGLVLLGVAAGGLVTRRR
ncbi:SRPBCC family protein [Nocardioides dongkuii]|uniref:SRPBCC family protein n=1 Tax=Nocardioides dongkuii TaxID=2760089 RepID=UPI0015FDC1F4|nr:carbon monoxide dehydrogenase subunit G [Nocardioides dongkuii]